MSGQRIDIGVNANTGQAEDVIRKLDRAAGGAADSIGKISDEAAEAARKLNEAAIATERLAKARAVLNRELGQPIDNGDAEKFLENFDRMRKGKGMGAQRMRSYEDFESWWEGHSTGYGSDRAAAQHRRMIFSQGMQGTQFARQYGAPPLGGGGGGGEGGGDDDAPGALARRGGSMAWGMVKGGLALAGIGGVMSMLASGVSKGDQENISTDTLKRRLGDLGVDFEGLRQQVRQTTDGMGVTYTEGQRLAATFTSLVGLQTTRITGMREGIGLSRSYGLEPEQGVAFMGNMRRLGVANDEQSSRRLAMAVSDAITQGGWTAKADEVMAAITDYTQQSARVMLGTPNTMAYSGYLTSLMGTGRPGLDPSGAAAILSAADSSVRRGGAFGEASLNMSLASIMRGLPGIDPVSAKALMEGGLFGTTQGTFGEKSILGQWYAGHNVKTPTLNDTTNFERMMPMLREQYGDSPYFLEAVQNHFGLGSKEQAAVVSGMRPGDMNASRRLVEENGLKFENLSGTGMRMLSSLANAKSGGAVGAVYDNVMGRDDLSDEERERLSAAMGRAVASGSVDALKNALVEVVGTKEQERTEGEKTRTAMAEIENATTTVGQLLLVPLNIMREAIVAIANHLSPGYRNATAERERRERVDNAPQVNGTQEWLDRNPSAGARADYGRVRADYVNRLKSAIAASPNGEVDLDSIIRAPDPELLNRKTNKAHWEREYYRQLGLRQAVEREYAATRPAAPDQTTEQQNRAALDGIAPGARAAGGVDMGGSRADRENTAFQYYLSKGLSRSWAAAMVGNLSHESGGMNPLAVGDGGEAHGYAQWRDARWDRFQAWARQNGRNPNDPQAQLDYTMVESETPDGGNIAARWRANPNASLAQATREVAVRYERPKRVNGEPHGLDSRLAAAARVAGSEVPVGDPSVTGVNVNVTIPPTTITLQDGGGRSRGTAVLAPVARATPSGT